MRKQVQLQRIYNSNNSTSSLNLDDVDLPSVVDANSTPRHSYNTRLSAKLGGARLSSNEIQNYPGTFATDNDDEKATPTLIVVKPKFNICVGRQYWCFIAFITIASLVILCGYLMQIIQNSQDSRQYFSQELMKMKREMTDMKTHVQIMSASKNYTRNKLEIIETVLTFLKRSSHGTSNDPKCMIKDRLHEIF